MLKQTSNHYHQQKQPHIVIGEYSYGFNPDFMQMCSTFEWVLEIHSLVLMIMLQVFYQLSHLPNQHFQAVKIVTLLSKVGGGPTSGKETNL